MKTNRNNDEEVGNGFATMLTKHRRGLALHEASTLLEDTIGETILRGKLELAV